MRPTAWAGGAAAVAAVLGGAGLVFDAPAAAGAATGIAALLGARAALFLARTARVADGLVIERSTPKTARQGAPVRIAATATAPSVPGLAVRFTDLPPASALLADGDPVLEDGRAGYGLRFMAPGEVSFRGVQIDARDRFFSTTLLCTAPPFAGPALTVFPAGEARTDPGIGMRAGELEREQKAILRGQGVIAYRPFRAGDDRALVDYKLSAKHGRDFVREPNSQAGNSPLLVVDLPAPGAPGGEAVLTAAGEAVEREFRQNGRCSLVVIAGGELVAARDMAGDQAELVRLIGWRKESGGIGSLYRVPDPVVARQRLRGLEGGSGTLSRRLAAALRANLRHAGRTPFEEDLSRAFSGLAHRDVIVYTAAAGEISHLNLITAAVRRRGQSLRVRFRHPSLGALVGLPPDAIVEAL
ncbi:MAG: hypothetical protein ABFC89_02680 [Methanospirillum sp.]